MGEYPDRDALVADLRLITDKGLTKTDLVDLKTLSKVIGIDGDAPWNLRVSAVEKALLDTTAGLDKSAQTAARAVLGIGQGIKGAPRERRMSIASDALRGPDLDWHSFTREPLTKLLGEVAYELFRDVADETVTSDPPPADDLPATYDDTSFLYTLDDQGADQFPDLANGAIQLDVLSRTSANLLGNYREVLASVIQNGAGIRIVMVDPGSSTAQHLYGENLPLFLYNAKSSMHHVEFVEREGNLRSGGGSLQIRLLQDFPPFSMVSVEKSSGESLIRVQLNFLHTRIGRDRPVFDLTPARGGWHRIFQAEFEAVWSNCEPTSTGRLKEYLESL